MRRNLSLFLEFLTIKFPKEDGRCLCALRLGHVRSSWEILSYHVYQRGFLRSPQSQKYTSLAFLHEPRTLDLKTHELMHMNWCVMNIPFQIKRHVYFLNIYLCVSDRNLHWVRWIWAQGSINPTERLDYNFSYFKIKAENKEHDGKSASPNSSLLDSILPLTEEELMSLT